VIATLIVIATLRAKVDVVNVQEDTVAASGDHASTAVASHDLAANARRDVLPRARHRLTHVGRRSLDVADMLRVAHRHLNDLRSNFDLLTPSLLPTAPATLTDRQCNLVAGPPRIGRSTENSARNGQQRAIVVERTSGISANPSQRFAYRSKRFRRYLEAEHVALELRIARALWQIALRVACHECLNLTNGATARNGEPSVFARGGGNACQLACSRPGDGAITKELLEHWQ
jgi:hypothetical protein